MTNNSFLIDTHCHIDLYKVPEAVVREAELNRVYTIAVTNAPFVFKHTAELVASCRYVRVAAGLHPELVAKYGNQIESLRPLLKETKYVGEIGLDYTTNDENLRLRQRKILERILGWCAEEKSKILTLHSRRAAADVISMIGDSFPGKAILHWFTGNTKEVERAADFGMYFSVNPAMVLSNRGKSLISAMPINRVLTESDGPFVKVFGHECKPQHLGFVAAELAKMWDLSPQEAQQKIYENFCSLLKGSEAKK
ncbi:MAG TPA: TatD family hydrolase [Pyrinomonadaceae bacterium]|nr:TatD family hydrolase [Pyrinomonadaceae bacterium]